MRTTVSQFIVILPEAVMGILEPDDLLAYLERFFPRYVFLVDADAPFYGKDYGLIPVVGVLGDDGGKILDPAPKADVLAIMDALREYGDGTKLRH